MNQYYYHYIQYLCLGFTILFYKSLRKNSLGLLMPLMILVCIVETSGRYYKHFGLNSNHGIINCYFVPAVFIYYALFGKLIRMKRWQAIVYRTVATITMVFALLDWVILSAGKFVQTTATVSALQHVLLSIWLLAQITFNESKNQPLTSEPFFWFSTGLMIFSIGASVFFGLRQYIYDNKFMVNGRPLYAFFGPMINVVIYSCYCVVAYLSYRNAKRESVLITN